MIRSVASHYVFIVEERKLYKKCVVRLNDGIAQDLVPLTDEIASVEWLPGLIALSKQPISVDQLNEVLRNSTLTSYNEECLKQLSLNAYYVSALRLKDLKLTEKTKIRKL